MNISCFLALASFLHVASLPAMDAPMSIEPVSSGSSSDSSEEQKNTKKRKRSVEDDAPKVKSKRPKLASSIARADRLKAIVKAVKKGKQYTHEELEEKFKVKIKALNKDFRELVEMNRITGEERKNFVILINKKRDKIAFEKAVRNKMLVDDLLVNFNFTHIIRMNEYISKHCKLSCDDVSYLRKKRHEK